MKENKPVRVKRYRSEGHKLETRVFAREIHETYCVDPKCKFRGKRAAQGICHTKGNLTGISHQALDKLYKYGWRQLEEMRGLKKFTQKEWIKYLEVAFVGNVLNYTTQLDEVVQLRAENSRLRLKLGIYK